MRPHCQPQGKGQRRDAQHYGHEHARDPVSQPLNGGLRSLGLTDGLHDPGKYRIGTHLSCLEHEAACSVDGGADDAVSHALFDRETLAGHHGFIDRGPALGDDAVDGDPLASLPLPVAGIMSPEPLETVAGQLETVEAAAASLGVGLPEPFAVLSFLALPVIPELRLTDLGLVDVQRMALLPLAAD